MRKEMIGKSLAVILEKIALNSAKVVSECRCVYCLHQPKQPKDIKKFFK